MSMIGLKPKEGKYVAGKVPSSSFLREKTYVAGQVPSSIHINENLVLEMKLELHQAAMSCDVYLSIIYYNFQWKYCFWVFSTSIVSEGV